MDAIIAGVGAWGPGFANLEQFQQLVTSGAPPATDDVIPKPDRIAARERRRAPLMVKLAIEVADQACQMANLDPATAQSVFTSGIGDADITDYMCRVLAGPDKLLSPTKFHNSVHNAAAGYWSISTACEKPATFISSMHNSFSLALIEAMVQVTSDKVPVLLVVSDLAMPEPMRLMHPIERMLGVAILLTPVASIPSADNIARPLSLSLQAASTQSVSWPSLATGHLNSLYRSSPAARSLCFLEAMCHASPWSAQLPVSEALAADLSLEPSSNAVNAISQLGG